ncbi:protein kinase family protein [Pleurocapsa sp. PCC 7327]|uniref:serine/threonine-protein kinase n=1 Tax=Pleurocapsa sp. PCC 7327 TaxID=118163 RepID=UPI00029F9DFB|nr:serine/threonine-protein kinase [Pleurocapsa sp. PCC 7327]AFY76282.1 protein kinase family protein [Pleurocapsa sp. PCC 7327]
MQRSKYRILGQIGQGQFGRVFCAVHRETGEIVALKDLDKDRFPTRLFLREFAHLTSLKHPNIVSCQGLEYGKTRRYLVMDYCEGGTLRDVMESEGKLSLVHGLKIITDVLLALEHAHSRDIVHCDLKPENILLKIDRSGWTACISDFGIARLKLEAGGKGTGRGYTGSPAYMAPERFYAQYSPASDFYAVGVMLYELILGKRPFSGMPGELQSAHLNQPIEIPKSVPFLLRSTILTALQKLPQRRFSCASEMLKSVRLAAEVLAAEKYPTGFLSLAPLEVSSNDLKILFQEPLSEPITHLAVDSQQVYLAIGNRVLGRIYASNELTGNPVQQWQVKFDAPVVDLNVRPQGGFVTTKSHQETYAIYCLSKSAIDLICCLSGGANDSETSELVPLFSHNAKTLVSAIESQGHWIAIASDTPSKSLQIFKLPDFQSLGTSIDSPLPSQLIALDRHHGLAIFSFLEEGSDDTVFRLFNRRGRLIDAFSLPITLHRVTPSTSEPYRLFAIEKSDPIMSVLINLKPLKVTRITLEIVPEFILEREWGYILVDRSGQFRLLDREGNRIGQFEVPFPPTAMAAFGEFKMLVATWSERKGILFAIDFQKIVNFKKDDDGDLRRLV